MTEGTLYAVSADGWAALGTGVLRFTEAAAKAEEDNQAFLKLWQGGEISFTSTLTGPSHVLRRMLCYPDSRRCYTCMRLFPGIWQRRKHERTAH